MTNKQFLQDRRQGIGGSDIAAIIGVSQFKTALDVFLSKTTEQPELKGEHLYWGHALEAPIAARFSEETGELIYRQPEIKKHPKHDFALANADGLIIDKITQQPIGILEIKTANAFKTKEWSNEDDGVPIEYIAQVQWYMEIFDVDFAYIAVLIGGSDYRHYRIERDRELAADLLARAKEFWENHVMKNVPPEPQNAADVQKLYPQDDGEAQQADTETLIAYNELRRLKEQAKVLDEQITEREEMLKTKIGQRAIMLSGEEKLFTWKTQNSNRFDSQAFKAAHPDLYQQYTKTTQTRVFRA
ncbi:YqaJ viral recombinase family protein [Kingella negevensis]|uniref:YqaJ-like viral recombinase domain protein n=1 Tax=Kingella negevensis TaxID=1522312 RepID=A0A238HEG3_9NEIS|nr:YqaJ viral recombinase family protein [Kingella negevensis]MDK4680172.1 YqaJ viral recombinase family protein [Kingella negevensis]MDK4682108.1 YqaJ viral recombinase family protein [Kingella negevensis]MDK4690304.1 YqaJ viral recombinase family protein [Kingella negevensis]MDK4692350.1 YqaJ viral recombinase family protein [Kingella negevensis]MDK4696489.1 YqaJ viral recombinase family protein [Kingella negevensis]